MFGGSSAPNRDRTPLNVEAYRASSNESAKPVPYFCGKQRFALNFISEIFDEKAVAVTQEVGKQKTKAGYNYYASFAALACHGPVDAIYDIFLNGDSVFAESTTIRIVSLTRVSTTATARTKNAHGLVTGQQVLIKGAEQLEYNGTFTITVLDADEFTYTVSGTPATPATTPDGGKITARVHLDPIFRDMDNPEYVDITIPDYGIMRLYWGTETQSRDPYLQTSGTDHPTYRGLCYAVFNQLFLGFNQTNVQNIEIVAARYPTTSWLDQRNINDDTNLISFAADVLQNPRAWLGLPDDRIDIDVMLNTADLLDDEAMGFSPIITREQESRQSLGQAFEYFDAYWSFNPNGSIGVKVNRKPEGEITEVADDDLLAKPTFETEDWTATKNETRVKFTNRLLEYKEDAIGRPDTGARAITGEPSSQTLDMSWFTDADVAGRFQESANLSASIPKVTCRLKLKKRSALFDALAPGAPFTLDYSQRNTTNLIFRVDKRTWPSPARAEFEVECHVDRSYLYQ